MYRNIEFPAASEYPPYAEMYMKLLKKDGSLLQQLEYNLKKHLDLMTGFTENQLNFHYAAGKWTLKEVLVHIIDDERIYAYRALCFARNETMALPGFDEKHYSQNADCQKRSLESIMREYKFVRMSTIALFEGLSNDALKRIGTADGKRSSVRALGYHIAGHELHHFNIIEERYLSD